MYIDELEKYDGKLLHKRFAYKFFRKRCNPIGDVIIFRGAMEVLADAMIDQEDVLANAFIFSEDAINILWEIPMLGSNAFGAVAYQRLFNTKIAEVLSGPKYMNQSILMNGDDMMTQNTTGSLSKISVSITHIKDYAALGHTGINIIAGKKAPTFAYSTELSDRQVKNFSDEIINLFYTINHDIFIATTKVY